MVDELSYNILSRRLTGSDRSVVYNIARSKKCVDLYKESDKFNKFLEDLVVVTFERFLIPGYSPGISRVLKKSRFTLCSSFLTGQYDYFYENNEIGPIKAYTDVSYMVPYKTPVVIRKDSDLTELGLFEHKDWTDSIKDLYKKFSDIQLKISNFDYKKKEQKPGSGHYSTEYYLMVDGIDIWNDLYNYDKELFFGLYRNRYKNSPKYLRLYSGDHHNVVTGKDNKEILENLKKVLEK